MCGRHNECIRCECFVTGFQVPEGLGEIMLNKRFYNLELVDRLISCLHHTHELLAVMCYKDLSTGLPTKAIQVDMHVLTLDNLAPTNLYSLDMTAYKYFIFLCSPV